MRGLRGIIRTATRAGVREYRHLAWVSENSGRYWYLQTSHWSTIKQFVLRRANHRCELCGVSTALHIHHLHYSNIGNERPEDLVALCKNCHKATHAYGRGPHPPQVKHSTIHSEAPTKITFGNVVGVCMWLLSIASCSAENVTGGFILFILGPILSNVIDSKSAKTEPKRKTVATQEANSFDLSEPVKDKSNFLWPIREFKKTKILLFLIPFLLIVIIVCLDSIVPESPVTKAKNIYNARLAEHKNAVKAHDKALEDYKALWFMPIESAKKKRQLEVIRQTDEYLESHPPPEAYKDYINPQDVKEIVLTPNEQMAKDTQDITIIIFLIYLFTWPIIVIALNKVAAKMRSK